MSCLIYICLKRCILYDWVYKTNFILHEQPQDAIDVKNTPPTKHLNLPRK